MTVKAGRVGLRYAALLAAFAVTLVGCADDEEGATVEGAQVLFANGALEGESDAMVSGVIAKIGDCVGIKVEQTIYPLIWPQGAKVEGSRVRFSGESFGLGDELSGGGAYLAEPHPSLVPTIPDGCRSDTGEIVLLAKLR